MKSYKLFFLAMLALAMFACEPPQGPETEEPDRTMAEEISGTESAFDDAVRVLEIAVEESGVYKTEMLCATIDLDTANKILTIDFGTGCTGPDGHTRTGLITVHYVGKYRQPGSEFSLSFTDYSLDGHTLNGTLIIKGFALNSDGQLFFSIIVENGSLKKSTGETIYYSGNRVYTWLKGADTPDNPSDDVYSVGGNAIGSNSNGDGYTAETIEALVFKVSCAEQGIQWPVDGLLEITSTAFNGTLGVEYGTGSCDKDVILIWKGKEYPLSL